MEKRIIQYKVKPERCEENEVLIKKLFVQLHADQPNGLKYASFKLRDGISFFHVLFAAVNSDQLTGMLAFTEFAKNIKARCDEGPQIIDLDEIGSYGFSNKESI